MCEVIERNRAEAMLEIQTANVIEMLRDNLSMEKIAQYTRLTIEQIKDIDRRNALL